MLAFPLISNKIAQVVPSPSCLIKLAKQSSCCTMGNLAVPLPLPPSVPAACECIQVPSRCAAASPSIGNVKCSQLPCRESHQIEPLCAAGQRLSLGAEEEWRLTWPGLDACLQWDACGTVNQRRTTAYTTPGQLSLREDVADEVVAWLPRRVGLWINKKAQIKFEIVAKYGWESRERSRGGSGRGLLAGTVLAMVHPAGTQRVYAMQIVANKVCAVDGGGGS